MNSTTKFFQQINKINSQINKKIWGFQKNILLSVFFLFFGFVFGNLFGTFLNYFRQFLNWDGLIITITIFIVEFINYLNYQKMKQKKDLKIFFVSKNQVLSLIFYQNFFLRFLKKRTKCFLKQTPFFSMIPQKIKRGILINYLPKFNFFVWSKKNFSNIQTKKRNQSISSFLFKTKVYPFKFKIKNTHTSFFVFLTLSQTLPLTKISAKQRNKIIIKPAKINKAPPKNFFPIFVLFYLHSFFSEKTHNKQMQEKNKVKPRHFISQSKRWAQKYFLTLSTKLNQQHKTKLAFFFSYFFIETYKISKMYQKGTKKKLTINFIKLLNFYKIGLLLGFFIDAFKVGS